MSQLIKKQGINAQKYYQFFPLKVEKFEFNKIFFNGKTIYIPTILIKKENLDHYEKFKDNFNYSFLFPTTTSSSTSIINNITNRHIAFPFSLPLYNIKKKSIKSSIPTPPPSPTNNLLLVDSQNTDLSLIDTTFDDTYFDQPIFNNILKQSFNLD